jgi:HEAT repeat protein
MNRPLVSAALFLVVNVSSTHAGALEFLGKSVDTWKKELNNRDASVRRSAAFALGRMGEGGRGGVSQLVRRLQEDNDSGVRDMAASAIGDIARALKGANDDVWEKSGGMLVKILKEDSSEQVRRSAAYALGAFGPQAAGAMNDLVKALGDGRASVRQNAAWALGQIGEEAATAVPKLCECLSDKDTLVRRDAAGALGSMGKAAEKAGRPLIELVKSESDNVVKKTALDSLANLAGPEQAESATELGPLLKEKDPEIRWNAALVLARIGGEQAAPAVPVLSEALKAAEPDKQELVAAALATLGPRAKPAMYDLADTLTDTRKSVKIRRNAALAIAHIGPAAEPVVPAVVKALDRGQPLLVRQFAAEAMARINYPANKKAVPNILDAIKNDKDEYVRHRCVFSLSMMDKPEFTESGAKRVLTKVLDERDPDMALVRFTAAYKLAHTFQDEAPERTPDVLLEMLQDTRLKIYKGTDAQVEGAGTEAGGGRANVKQNLGGDARYMAALALGWLGKKASSRHDVVKALRNAAKDSDAKLRNTAKDTMKDLGIKE